MSLHTDQAANPLALLTWGTQPPNSRRRRRAWLAVCLPTASYCLFLMAFYFQWVPASLMPSGMVWNRQVPENLLELATISSALTMSYLLAASIVVRSLRGRPARQLRINWPDYRLAGLTGRQMLRGLGGPGFAGFSYATEVHLIVYAVCMLLYGLFVEFDSDFWAILVLGLAPAFAFSLYPIVDVAFWVLMPSTLARLIGSTAITIATGPMMVFTGFWIVAGSGSFVYLIAVAEVVSWPIRMLLVRWLWRKAIRRLDNPLSASSESRLRA